MSKNTTVSIGIASKDRPEVVSRTLQNILAFGLGDYPLILCDDGSDPPLAPKELSLFPNAELIRNDYAIGDPAARNRIAKICKTEYLLQLDDDSYPISGSLEELIYQANKENDWLAIAIPFEEPARNRRFPLGINESKFKEIRSFVGCSVLLNVRRFNSLGGYAAWIGRMGEENELSLRALNENCSIVTVDLLRIRHDVSSKRRSTKQICFQLMRNNFLLWAFHAPLFAIPWCLSRLVFAAFVLSIRQLSFVPLMGLVNGLKTFWHLRGFRSPVKIRTFFKFKRLPHPLDLYEK